MPAPSCQQHRARPPPSPAAGVREDRPHAEDPRDEPSVEAGAEHPACPQPRQAQPRALGAQRGVPTRKAQGAARHSPVFNYRPGHACFPAGGAAGRSTTPGRRPARRGPPAPLPSIPAAGRRARPVGGLRGGAGADDPHAGQGESRLGRGLRRLKRAGAQSGRNCPDGLFTCARTGPRNLPARRHSFAHTHTHTNPFPAPARGQPGPGRAPASLTRKARPGPAAPPHSAARRAGGSPCALHCFGDSERLLMELCWWGGAGLGFVGLFGFHFLHAKKACTSSAVELAVEELETHVGT